MDLKLHVGYNILKFHALHAHIWPRTWCHKLPPLSVRFVSGALNLAPKTYHTYIGSYVVNAPSRIDFVGPDNKKYPPWENAVKIVKWSGKTKTAIISSKSQFRPQFWAQIVAGVETHRYSPVLGHGDLFFFFLGKVMRKTMFRKFAIGSTIRF
jgi:hypothetical protein